MVQLLLEEPHGAAVGAVGVTLGTCLLLAIRTKDKISYLFLQIKRVHHLQNGAIT